MYEEAFATRAYQMDLSSASACTLPHLLTVLLCAGFSQMTRSLNHRHFLQLTNISNNNRMKLKLQRCVWLHSVDALNCAAIVLLFMVTCVGCTLNVTQQPDVPGLSMFDTSRCPQLAHGNLEECLVHTFSLFNQKDNTGIPVNQQQIQHMCSVFQHGFECLDLLAQACLNSDELRLYLNNVTRVRHIMDKVCQDPQFQLEYLKHSHCYQELSKDWESCSDPLLTHLNQDLNKQVTTNSQLIDICSINQNFLDCITRAAHQRCDNSAAKFISELAVTLSGSMDQCPQPDNLHSMESTAHKHWAKESSDANGLYSRLYLTIFSTTMAILTS